MWLFTVRARAAHRLGGFGVGEPVEPGERDGGALAVGQAVECGAEVAGEGGALRGLVGAGQVGGREIVGALVEQALAGVGVAGSVEQAVAKRAGEVGVDGALGVEAGALLPEPDERFLDGVGGGVGVGGVLAGEAREHRVEVAEQRLESGEVPGPGPARPLGEHRVGRGWRRHRGRKVRGGSEPGTRVAGALTSRACRKTARRKRSKIWPLWLVMMIRTPGNSSQRAPLPAAHPPGLLRPLPVPS